MLWATTVCRLVATLAIVGVGACTADADGVRWNAPFGATIDEGNASSDDGAPTGPLDSGDDHDDGPPKPTSDTQAPGDDDDDDTTTDDGGSTTDDGGTTWHDVDETSSSGGEVPPADSGMDADPGTQPANGPWSSCEGATCSVGMGCLEGQLQGGVCTVACVGFDPTSCPASPGATVEPVCISVLGTGVCALDCTGGLVCPAGMTCVVDNDDDGPIEVCL